MLFSIFLIVIGKSKFGQWILVHNIITCVNIKGKVVSKVSSYDDRAKNETRNNDIIHYNFHFIWMAQYQLCQREKSVQQSGKWYLIKSRNHILNALVNSIYVFTIKFAVIISIRRQTINSIWFWCHSQN